MKDINVKTNLLRATAALLLTTALSWTLQAAQADDGNSIKIGVLVCQSGDCAEIGTNSLHGAQLAVAQINASGGVLGKRLSLVVEDSRDTTPSSTVSAFKKLRLNSDIHYFIGSTWSVGGLSIAPIIARAKDIIVTSPSIGMKEFNETADNILNVWPHDEIGTQMAARYAYNQGWKRAAIFGNENPWVIVQSNTFASEFKAAGGTITAQVSPLPDSRELRAEALRIIRSDPQVIFLSNYQYDVIAKELRALKYKGQLIAILMEKDRVKSADGALEGALFAQYAQATDSFRSAYRAVYGNEPGIAADTGYDIVQLYARVIREQGTTDTAKTLPALHAMKDYPGASGRFSFDAKGAVNKKPVLWRVKGSEYEKVFEE